MSYEPMFLYLTRAHYISLILQGFVVKNDSRLQKNGEAVQCDRHSA